jgi:hypothetical protein
MVALVDSISAAEAGIVAVNLSYNALPHKVRPAAATLHSAHKLVTQDATVARHIAARYLNVLQRSSASRRYKHNENSQPGRMEHVSE